MKKLLFLLSILIPMTLSAQDGLIGWIDTDDVDMYISIYNSPVDTRTQTFKYHAEHIQLGNLKTGNFVIAVNTAIVEGETFVTITDSYILYGIYVDRVLYYNGNTYSATRYEKPSNSEKLQ